MTSKFVLASVMLASSAIGYAQEQAPPPPEPTPSEAASQHEPPKGAAATPAAVAPDKAPKWDVEHPRGPTIRKVPLDTTEGTWMNVDVSPDGTRVAFDMLGDISPRAASRSAKGREKIAVWLKHLENRSRHADDRNAPMATYDFTWLWRELKVEHLRN